MTVGDVPGELLDVHAAVPQRPALPVGLGDLGLERHDAFEPGLEFGHARASVPWPVPRDGPSADRGARPIQSRPPLACLPPGSTAAGGPGRAPARPAGQARRGGSGARCAVRGALT